MELFSEEKLFSSAGLSTPAKAKSIDEAVNSLVHKNYKDSLVTRVTLDEDDWETAHLHSARFCKRRLCFTPVKGYEEHRAALADMFPAALVIWSKGTPLFELKPRTRRVLSTLFSQNYLVAPLYVHGNAHLSCRGLDIFSSGYGWTHTKSVYKHSNVVDVFAGGRVITDRMTCPTVNLTVRDVAMECNARAILDACKVFEKTIDTAEEVAE